MENFHILKITYIPETNTKPSRVRILSERFNESIVIPRDQKFRDIAEVAEHHLKKLDFSIIGQGEHYSGFYIISDTFKSLK